MRRLLLILPLALIVAGAAFGTCLYFLHGSEAPARTVTAVELKDDSAPLQPQANAPLDAPDKPEPLVEASEYPTSMTEPERHVEAPEPADPAPTAESLAKELKATQANDGLTDEEIATRVKELKKTLEVEGELPVVTTLSGRVLDYAGQPVPNADVIVTRYGGGEKRRKSTSWTHVFATTDAEGNFEGGFKSPARENNAFEIELFARAGAAPESEHQKLTVTPGEVYAGLVINMTQGAGITGRVVDSNYSPVAGASVLAIPSDPAIYTGRTRPTGVPTDADGRFTIVGLIPGSYCVTAGVSGYTNQSAWPIIEVGAGDPTALASDMVLKMETGIKLKLVCTENQPSGQFTVNFYRADGSLVRGSSVANDAGVAIVVGVPENAVELEIVMRGYMTSSRVAIAPIAGAHIDLGEISLQHSPQISEGIKSEPRD